MLISYTHDQDSIILRVKILNSSVSTGAGLTGLTSSSTGLIISTIADNEATATAYTVAASNVETITTLGTYAAPTASKCRFKEVDATNHKGVYEIHLADARFAVASAKYLMVSISGATNAAECDVLIPLTQTDPYDNVRGGITALPNAAADAAGGLAISDAGGLDLDAILVDTNALNDTKIPDTISLANINAEVDTALTDIHLDHLLAADYDPATKPGIATALLNELIESDAGVSRFTANALEQGPDTDHTGTGTGLTAIPWNASWDAEVQSECNDALVALGLDHLLSASVAGTDVTDNSIVAKLVSASATADWDDFVNTTDSLQAIRDRGDTSWITGGGGGISDIVNIQPLMPPEVDLADTVTWRLGLMLVNSLDDLPTTAEITPGTISIDRKAIGGTSWSSVVADAACSESAGLIYYDEVFDSGTGYAEGDSLRITFKSQSLTISANDYEISDATGRIFYTRIAVTMRGTDNAALATALATVDTNVDAILVDTGTTLPATLTTIEGKIDTVDTNVDAILVDTGTTLPATLATIDGNVDAILVDTGTTLPATLATIDANVDAILVDTGTTIPATIATIDGNVDAILVDTGTTLPATLTTIEGKIDTVDTNVDAILVDTGTTVPALIASELSDALTVDTLVDGQTIQAALRIIAASTAGILSGAGTGTEVVKGLDGTTTRITATVDGSGNRSGMTY